MQCTQQENTQEIVGIELEMKDFLPLSNEKYLNKETRSCLGTPAFHFTPTITHNINNFERIQQHCNVQNENLG